MEFPSRDELNEKYINEDDFETSIKVLQESVVYTWVRLYTSEIYSDIKPGDKLKLIYSPSGEEVDLTFGTYDKINSIKDHDDEVTNYTQEEDKKSLCIMVDIKSIESNESIPFIRTLFRASKWYTQQLMKRSDLLVQHNGTNIEYTTIKF